MDVLVYLDPSPRGEWALAVAAALPPRWRGTRRLLATEEDASAHPGLVEGASARLGASGPVEALTRPGPAERAVIEEAHARRYGLLVVSPAGRGAVARMLKGSRVATVVHGARTPVLVARRPPGRIERVLGALSGRDTTGAVVEATLAWEERPGARAAFVHVRSEVPLPLGADEAPPEVPGAADLAAAHAALAARGRAADLQLRDGLVVEETLDAFEEGAFHLLVVGAHGEGSPGFGREDLTERLLLGCPGSTLVVPALDPNGSLCRPLGGG
jgi:nucleotide-binding universal stress UspA family protein